MRVAIDRLIRFELVPLLLVLALAPLAQAQELVVTEVEAEALTGPIEIARARAEVAGSDNLEYVHNNFPGSDTASFSFHSGLEESFDWTYDGRFLLFSLDGTTVARFSTDRIGILFIECHATAPSSAARLSWNVNQTEVPGAIIPGGSASGVLEVTAGDDESEAVRFSGPVFRSFRIFGSLRKVFEAAPDEDGLSCQFIVSALDRNDTDGDGVANSQDNCPSTFNPGQENTDENEFGEPDALGDACDLCPDVFDLGEAEDFDGDGVPDSCDNCSQAFCEDKGLPLARCYNPEQRDEETDVGPDGEPGVEGDRRLCPPDPDDPLGRPKPVEGSDDICGDTVGGSVDDEGNFLGCDNCPRAFNLDQTPSDDPGLGLACSRGGAIQQEFLPDEVSEPPVVNLMESVAAVGAPGAVGDPRFFTISVDCGSFDVSAFTTGVQLSAGVAATFADCNLDTAVPDGIPDDPTTRSCANVPTCSNGLAEGCLDESVSAADSWVFGPNLISGIDPDGVTDEIFYLRVLGARDEGLPENVICRAEEPAQEIGLLRVTGLGETETILLTQTGLGGEPIDFNLLEDANTGNVPATQTTTSNLAGDERARITVSPALPAFDEDAEGNPPGDAAGLFASQITLFSEDTFIHNLCIGLQASRALGEDAVVVGGCTVERTIEGVRFFTCPEPNLELGPTISPSDGDDTPGTYVLAANEPTAAGAIDNLLEDTTYFVMRGALDDVSGERTSINDIERETLLGVHRYTMDQQPGPLVRFQGCQEILNHIGDPDLQPDQSIIENAEDGDDESNPIDPLDLTLIGGFDRSGDIDRDMVANDTDICVNAFDPEQLDGGTAVDSDDVAAATVGDFIGNACQCGDGNGVLAELPGTVRPADDVEACQRAAAGDPTMDEQARARCSVTGSFEVTSADLLLLSQALDPAFPEVTPAQILEQRCQPAVVPPPPPPEEQ